MLCVLSFRFGDYCYFELRMFFVFNSYLVKRGLSIALFVFPMVMVLYL